MGLVLQNNEALIANYEEETITWNEALIEPGRPQAQLAQAKMSSDEVRRLVLKMDQMAMSRQHEGIAVMIAEEMASILAAVRRVKTETKEEFWGLLGAGANLDIAWLRPKDFGNTLLNPLATASKGLYGGTSLSVYTWLHTFVANTSDDILPTQIMSEESGMIHLGAIDPIEVPKLNMITFTLAGIPAPAQSMPFNIRRGFGIEEVPFVRFEKPIIIGPERTQLIEVMPNIAGDSKFQLLSLVIARAQDLTA